MQTETEKFHPRISQEEYESRPDVIRLKAGIKYCYSVDRSEQAVKLENELMDLARKVGLISPL